MVKYGAAEMLSSEDSTLDEEIDTLIKEEETAKLDAEMKKFF